MSDEMRTEARSLLTWLDSWGDGPAYKHGPECDGKVPCENCSGEGFYCVIEGDFDEEREYKCEHCNGIGTTDCYGCE